MAKKKVKKITDAPDGGMTIEELVKKKVVKKTLNTNGTAKMPEMGAKKPSKEEPDIRYVYDIVIQQTKFINILTNRIIETNQRIDNIVNAHERCKSLKGL